MNSLVFVVEDDKGISLLFKRKLSINGIACITAANLEDAIELFERNKEVITHIALDGTLTKGRPTDEDPETLLLAKIIADSSGFRGQVFAMSSMYKHNEIIKRVVGPKCEICGGSIVKNTTLNEIIKRIKEKEEKRVE